MVGQTFLSADSLTQARPTQNERGEMPAPPNPVAGATGLDGEATNVAGQTTDERPSAIRRYQETLTGSDEEACGFFAGLS